MPARGPRPTALTAMMVSAIGACLTALGAIGAASSAWQLLHRLATGDWPVPAAAWADAGRFGALITLFIRGLPVVLVLALLFHGLVAWLGFGLAKRRRGARRAVLWFVAAWDLLGLTVWALLHGALADFASRGPAKADFAADAGDLATEVLILLLLLSGSLALLLTRPSVREEFGD